MSRYKSDIIGCAPAVLLTCWAIFMAIVALAMPWIGYAIYQLQHIYVDYEKWVWRVTH